MKRQQKGTSELGMMTALYMDERTGQRKQIDVDNQPGPVVNSAM